MHVGKKSRVAGKNTKNIRKGNSRGTVHNLQITSPRAKERKGHLENKKLYINRNTKKMLEDMKESVKNGVKGNLS